MPLNRAQIIKLATDLLKSGALAPEDQLNSVYGASKPPLVSSDSEALFDKAKTVEAAASFKAPEIFFYVAAINAKQGNATPQDYDHLIRAIKKQNEYQSFNYEELLTQVEQKRTAATQKEAALNIDFPANTDPGLIASAKQFFSPAETVLGKRLDVAYDLFNKIAALPTAQAQSPTLNNLQQQAVTFMKTVLNAKNDSDIAPLMVDRQSKSAVNPEYIPGRAPKNLTSMPNANAASDKLHYNWQRVAAAALALERGKIVKVNESSKQDDIEFQTKFLTPEQRESHQVVIRDNVFLQRNPDNSFSKVDTTLFSTHGDLERSAFTINLNGEISLFNHFFMKDHIAHSAMNAQNAVFFAGELTITNGVLTEFSAHSGHYRPDKENVYLALKFFQEQGIDISKVQVSAYELQKIVEDGKEVEKHVKVTKDAPEFMAQLEAQLAETKTNKATSTAAILNGMKSADPLMDAILAVTTDLDQIKVEIGQPDSFKVPNLTGDALEQELTEEVQSTQQIVPPIR